MGRCREDTWMRRSCCAAGVALLRLPLLLGLPLLLTIARPLSITGLLRVGAGLLRVALRGRRHLWRPE